MLSYIVEQEFRKHILKALNKKHPYWSDLKLLFESELILKSSIYRYSKEKIINNIDKDKLNKFYKLLKQELK